MNAKELIKFIESLPNHEDYIYIDDGKLVVSNEWLVETFAGSIFIGDTKEDAAQQLIDYIESHLSHKSFVGNIVRNCGYPDLNKMKEFCL